MDFLYRLVSTLLYFAKIILYLWCDMCDMCCDLLVPRVQCFVLKVLSRFVTVAVLDH